MLNPLTIVAQIRRSWLDGTWSSYHIPISYSQSLSQIKHSADELWIIKLRKHYLYMGGNFIAAFRRIYNIPKTLRFFAPESKNAGILGELTTFGGSKAPIIEMRYVEWWNPHSYRDHLYEFPKLAVAGSLTKWKCFVLPPAAHAAETYQRIYFVIMLFLFPLFFVISSYQTRRTNIQNKETLKP